MKATLSRLRRLVASIMLVATAAFVLHGSAMASLHAHGADSPQCKPATTHIHAPAAHDHGDGVVHVHADRSAKASGHDHGPNGTHHAAGNDGPCCSTVCSVTLAAFGFEVISAPLGLAQDLRPASQVGSGIDPNGLKRPPRTPCIA